MHAYIQQSLESVLEVPASEFKVSRGLRKNIFDKWNVPHLCLTSKIYLKRELDLMQRQVCLCAYVRMYVCMYVFVCMYVCMYVCM
jgi:hypothetical protein